MPSLQAGRAPRSRFVTGFREPDGSDPLAALDTPQAVINRAGVAVLPEYEDVSPMDDCAGFYAYRRYPPDTPLAQIDTASGSVGVRCYLRFVVGPPVSGSHIRRIDLRAWFSRRWKTGRVLASPGNPDDAMAGHPEAPTPQSRVLLAKASKPVDLDAMDMPPFIYDQREDAFCDEDRTAVTPPPILDRLYKKHCRTLGLRFRLRWTIGSIARRVIQQIVWKGQDAAMWALFTFYDVELVDDKKDRRHDFFYKYKRTDFRRSTDNPGERSHFFGFQTSRKSLFTNLLAVAGVSLFVYWKLPHEGLLRAIYANTALTTAALVLGFFIADIVGPWLLVTAICVLSRLRDAVFFLVRKVNA